MSEQGGATQEATIAAVRRLAALFGEHAETAELNRSRVQTGAVDLAPDRRESLVAEYDGILRTWNDASVALFQLARDHDAAPAQSAAPKWSASWHRLLREVQAEHVRCASNTDLDVDWFDWEDIPEQMGAELVTALSEMETARLIESAWAGNSGPVSCTAAGLALLSRWDSEHPEIAQEDRA